jgi:WD40 repeat protein
MSAKRSAMFYSKGKVVQRFTTLSLSALPRRWFEATCCLFLLLLCMKNANAQVAFSPDGKMLAAASSDHSTKLWDVSTGRLLRTLQGGPPISLSFSPDGKLLAAGFNFGIGETNLRLWDAATGAELLAAEKSGFSVEPAFSPDGRMLATALWDGGLKFWDVNTRAELRALHPVCDGPVCSVTSVAFSPDGKILATGIISGNGDSGGIKLWDVKTGLELRTLSGNYGQVQAVAVSPDGTTLATTNCQDTIKIWDIRTGAELRTLGQPAGGCTPALAFSPDGAMLASTEGEPNPEDIRIRDVKTGTVLRTLRGYSHLSQITHKGIANDLESVTFSPDGNVVAGSDYDRITKLWDVRSGSVLRTLGGPNAGDDVTPTTGDTGGSQTQPLVTKDSSGLRVTVDSAILFDLDRADLRPEAEAVLASVKSSVIDQHPHARVVVEGYTDDTGGDAHNLDLSTRRAQAVAVWLKNHGVDGSRIDAKGYGKSNPKYENTTEQNRARNRRVEIVIVE